jgi:hypothetical protein
MKLVPRFALLIVLVCPRPSIGAEARALHILFIGNSYLAANSFPALFQEMAASAGYPRPAIEAVTPGGYTLAQHAQDATTLSVIHRGASDQARWDVVVLQEQSIFPALAERFSDMRESVLRGIPSLFKRIKEKNPSADILVYETWARHPDLWRQSKDSVATLGANAREMQGLLRKWTKEATRLATASSPNLPIVCVGDLWELNYESVKPIRLHAGDGSHPDFAGSYLAGLALFAKVYKTSPNNVKYVGNLSVDDATTLKTLASNPCR